MGKEEKKREHTRCKTEAKKCSDKEKRDNTEGAGGGRLELIELCRSIYVTVEP
jgi:hypothetical protein